MGVSRDDDHRKIAAHFAEKWGAEPDIILWDGALHFDQTTAYPPEFEWTYQEWVRDEEGKWEREADGIQRKLVHRRRPIPEEWIEEYEQVVRDLYQGGIQ